MKKILLLVAFSFTLTSAYSQNEPIENARWLNARFNSSVNGNTSWLSSVYEISTSTKDTLINSKYFLKVFGKPNAPNAYAGALRADSTRWYFCAADSTEEMLLYDFGLQPGDTLTERIYVDDRTYVDSLICLNVSNWSFNGKTHKLIEFEAGGGNQLSSNYLERGKWLDGIGNWQGMLVEFYQNISQYSLYLACFSLNDSIIFSASPYPQNVSQNVGCDVTFSIGETPKNLTIAVYPNPAKNHLWVEWGSYSGSYTAEVLNLEGRVLSSTILQQAKSKLEINLAPGLYVLRCRDGLQFGSTVFSVKH